MKNSSENVFVHPLKASAVHDPEWRRMRLLGWILLTLDVILVLTVAIVIAFNQNDPKRMLLYLTITGVVLSAVSSAYYLNARGKHKPAAMIVVFIAMAASWLSILIDKRILTSDAIPILYIVVPILLSALFLSIRLTMTITLTQFTGLLALFLSNPALRFINWPSLFILTFVIAGIGLVSSIVSQRDLQHIDMQTDMLLNTEAKLRVLSERDLLTGLYNRNYLEQALEREYQKAVSTGSKGGIIMFDVDHFKLINDTHGHVVGDTILRTIGEVLTKHFRTTDIICRFGGDEFVVILPDASVGVTHMRALSLGDCIRTKSFVHEGVDLGRITISIGVIAYPDGAQSSAMLLESADKALYRAKHAGRDNVVLEQL
jgi:diguanylate cyclase (GGDEF)-like protein